MESKALVTAFFFFSYEYIIKWSSCDLRRLEHWQVIESINITVVAMGPGHPAGRKSDSTLGAIVLDVGHSTKQPVKYRYGELLVLAECGDGESRPPGWAI